MSKIKVLVVDDSALVRRIITDALQRDPDIEVVGTANNGKSAVFKTHTLNPDVITMDIEMPIMNGLDALKIIMQEDPKPVIMMSVLTQHGADATFKALELGAIDFIPKPSTMLSMSVSDIYELLVSKVKSVAESKIKFEAKKMQVSLKGPEVTEEETRKPTGKPKFLHEIREPVPVTLSDEAKNSDKIVAIGTSTGGPSALMTVFKGFPENFPSPVLVVQHMPEGFTKAFAERLNSNSNLNVKEAEDGDRLMSGCGYVAPGHSHVKLEKKGSAFFIKLDQGEKVSGHRPSIDFMFNSVADNFSDNIIAVIMTGMGKDGASGIRRIKENGGYTVAQNEETSVVYGMNKVAVEYGGVVDVVSLEDIIKKIVEHL
ncbi:MAG: chemotaxis response regulator protein-glutamate methylesterase [Spirochaetes bacterium]|nr:chemotaxis response regulator protein-glutamate methylesterase [Spirochaetota bacterium]